MRNSFIYFRQTRFNFAQTHPHAYMYAYPFIQHIWRHTLFNAIFLSQVIYYSYQRHLFCIFGDKSLILLLLL